MKKNSAIAALMLMGFLSMATIASTQPLLWFGTLNMEGKIKQGRFEIFKDSVIKRIVYAPYGITPIEFKKVKQQRNQLTFTWDVNKLTYQCLLLRKDSSAYAGNCTSANSQPIQLIIREVTNEDALLQGDTLHAQSKDIEILDRALELLNSGKNWDRTDNRVCDNSSYPYNWSLFCALHQASIDIDSEYRHLRPAIHSVRQAITEITAGKKYAHLLQDFNNEAESFEVIEKVLNRAKEIIKERMRSGK
jgi:hypothetical protein